MKLKWWGLLIIIILIAGITCGIVFGVKSCNEKKASVDGIVLVTDKYSEEQATVVKGQPYVLFKVWQSDKAFTSVKYRIDSGEEVAISGTSGEAATRDDLKARNGKYFFDTGITLIDTSALEVGSHVLTILVYQDATRTIVNEQIVKIVAAT